jgi:hypothetical protein
LAQCVDEREIARQLRRVFNENLLRRKGLWRPLKRFVIFGDFDEERVVKLNKFPRHERRPEGMLVQIPGEENKKKKSKERERETESGSESER